VVGFVNGGAADAAARYLASFRKGLSKTGFVESRNVTVEYHWMEGRYDRIPTVIADLVRRQVAVIATPGSTEASLAAKTATSTIPIVFGSAVDPVELGLVTSLARPGGNATGSNFFAFEVASKQFGLLHELVPKASRFAVSAFLCLRRRLATKDCPQMMLRLIRRRSNYFERLNETSLRWLAAQTPIPKCK
jgi:putative tryptophan/tyrosine transport system substrate-binding protein